MSAHMWKFKRGFKINLPIFYYCNFKSFSKSSKCNKGAILCVYEPKEKSGEVILNKTTHFYNVKTSGKISNILKIAGRDLKKGESRILYDLIPGYDSVAICCLGKQGALYNELEGMEEGWDNIRVAVASGVRSLRSVGETEVDVDPCEHASAAAEGAFLALFEYDELKDKCKKKVTLSCLREPNDGISSKEIFWASGKTYAESQNWARLLMETPSNMLTPRLFAEAVNKKFANRPNITVTIRDKDWISNEKMGAFLAVAQGSHENPYFLEIEYKHKDAGSSNPIVLVGKGITFDTGGISIKPSADMDKMRADMGGAACVVGSLFGLDQLNIPAYIYAFIPLCENMPSGTAIKPGDVVTARNGKTIQIDNTDAEGRLILADALCYAEMVNPELILDIATLTGAIDVALGSGATGVFSTSEHYWNLLQKAGSMTGDRVWRMPLFQHYSKQVTESQLADVNNVGKYSRSGGSCTAAAFLKEFVTNKNWLHLDIAGVMSNKDEVPYLGKGMAGRPTRTIMEFLQLVTKTHTLSR